MLRLMKISPWLRRRGLMCVVRFFCICVTIQMLGLPVMFLGLLNESILLKYDPVSEDVLMLSAAQSPPRPGLLGLCTERRLQRHRPVVFTMVFHSPAASPSCGTTIISRGTDVFVLGRLSYDHTIIPSLVDAKHDIPDPSRTVRGFTSVGVA
jgi:hypothetical protein